MRKTLCMVLVGALLLNVYGGVPLAEIRDWFLSAIDWLYWFVQQIH
jgi:hypothetical protein